MKKGWLISLLMLLIVGVVAGQDADDEPTLILYSTLPRLLSGEVEDGATLDDVRASLSVFPPEWAVVGVGTSSLPMQNGELMPDGTTSDLRFWWADPSSDEHNHLVRLESHDDAHETSGDAEATAVPTFDFDGELPFIVLSVADPEAALTFTARNINNVHIWLTATLMEHDIFLAGVQFEGTFDTVSTTIAYNLPLTGLDIGSNYMTEDHFHAVEYESGTWVMNGIYATDPDVRPLVAAGEQTLHLHGYQPDSEVAGHIVLAHALDATVTVYPLTAVVQEMPAEATPEPAA